LTGKTRVRNDL